MIGLRLKYERKKKGMFTIDLARLSGICEGTIRYIECKKNYPNSFTLYCLCQTLGITMEHAFKPMNNHEIKELNSMCYGKEKKAVTRNL